MASPGREWIRSLFFHKPLNWALCPKDSFLEEASREWLEPLIIDELIRHPDGRRIPFEILAPLKRVALREAALEAARAREVESVLKALDEPVLLLKGSALSHTVYPHPGLRPRCDTDLLIRPEDRESVFRAFEKLGFQPANMITGELVSYQMSCSGGGALNPTFDVHWRLSNAQLFSKLLNFESLLAESTAIEALGPRARGPSLRHSLLIACFHRVAHHFDHEDLLWLYDVKLIAEKMGAKALVHFRHWTKELGVWSVCRRSLDLATRWFPLALPKGLLSEEELDAASDYLNAGSFQQWLADMKHCGGWRDRARLVREQALPSRDYMRRKYPSATSPTLGAYYLFRLVNGAIRLWRA